MLKSLIMIYLVGVFFAEMLNLYKLFSGISLSLSIRAKNLKKIGLFYNLAKGTFTRDKSSAALLIFTVFDILFITPLLSWYPVILTVWFWFKSRANKTQVPDKLKELQFRLASIDMPKESVERIAAEIRDIVGAYGVKNTGEEYIEENQLSFGDHNEFRISPTSRRLTHEWHSPDFLNGGEAVSEYKIDGFNVEMRLIDQCSSEYGKKVYDAKDNVVLETEIRARESIDNSKFPSWAKRFEERINGLKSETNWYKLPSSHLKYFILSKHPNLFKDGELLSFYRKEFERLKAGKNHIAQLASQNGFIVKTTEYGTGLHYPDNIEISNEEDKRLQELHDNIFTDNTFLEAGFTKTEFNNIEDLLKCLSGMLDEKGIKSNI